MVTSVTSLGKNGLYDWIIQRVTAVVLGLYFLVMMGFLLFTPDLTFDQWNTYMSTTYMRIFTLLALISMAAHNTTCNFFVIFISKKFVLLLLFMVFIYLAPLLSQ